MKTIMIFTLLTLLFISAPGLMAQKPIPGAAQTKSILIKGGILHTGTGLVIKDALLGFKNGYITLVDSVSGNSDTKSYDTVITLDKEHIYPGFIAANTTIGLVEIEAVRATRDMRETGELNPNVRSLIAYNSDSKVIPTVRNNGILIAQVTPTDGWISGTSSVMNLDGWNWEDAVLKEDIGVHLNWMSESNFKSSDQKLAPNETYPGFVQQIRNLFLDARGYAKIKSPEVRNIRLESMKGLYTGDKKLFIHTNTAKDIVNAVTLAKDCGINNLVIVGGGESYKILDFLKENNIAVLIRKVHSLPLSSSEPIDMPFKLASILKEAGILFGFDCSGEFTEVRNLPFIAGTALGYGLRYEDVIQGLTLNQAKILSIDSKTGSLEPGKDATFFISKGDALEITGNYLMTAYIQGKKVDLRNEQTELYERYLNKYGLK